MLFPLSDDDRKVTKPAYVTWALLAINIAVFGYQMMNPDFTTAWSTIPKEITTGVDITEPVLVTIDGQDVAIPHLPGPSIIYLTLISSMFMHGGPGHIFGNMLYLWIFGDNVEQRFGSVLFLAFYLISGLVASFAQIAMNPEGVIPNLGASGAIFGVLGAYMVLFPRNQVKAIFIYTVISLPAIAVIGLWTAMQLYYTISSMTSPEQGGGVAYMAHVGGLVAGVVMGFIVRSMLKEEPDTTLYRQYKKDPRSKRWW
jgi:membrane associated rhomboid family serine protease